MNSKSSVSDDDSDTSSFQTTILSDHAGNPDSRSSTENSYKTAQTSSVDGLLSSVNASAACQKSEAARCFINRTVKFEFGPQPELDLTPITVEDCDTDTLRNMSTEGVSESKTIVSSVGTYMPRDFNTSDPRVDWDVHSNRENVSILVDDKTIKTNDNICKFIQDESMPEWAPSFCAKSTLCTSKYAEDDDLAKFRRGTTNVEIPRVFCPNGYKTQHNAEAKKIYRSAALNSFQSTCRENRAFFSPRSHASLDSTQDFERLEKYVEGLPSSPIKPLKKLRRSVSTSNLCVLSNDKLMNCTLDYANSLDFDTFDSHCHGAQEHQEQPSFRTNRDSVKQPSDNPEEINEVELSTSLLIEWRKKRQRCLDTAMKMQEIALESTSTNKNNSKLLDPYIDSSNEFIKTITTPSEYQNCLVSLRQNVNCKRTEDTSADSGIDALSMVRTLHSSDKKSCNKTSSKIQVSEGYLVSRLNKTRLETGTPGETDRKLRSASNHSRLRSIEQRAPRNVNFQAIPQKESPTSSSFNVKYARGRPKSRFCENCSPTRQNPSMIRYFTSPTPMRLGKYSNNSPPVLSDRKQSGRVIIDVAETTPQSASSPNYFLPSTLASPSMINHSKKITTKMSTCRTECCSVSAKTANSPRRKFFVTPGKSVQVNRDGKKRIFFPNFGDENKKDLSRRVMSLHEPGLLEEKPREEI